MEAVAIGMPVLSSFNSGIPELLEDGKHGYLSPEKDVEHIIKSMRSIVKWNNFRIKACREKIVGVFNKQIHAEKLDAIYAQVLK